ncbi:hypothetical protein ACLKA6_009719 [Drosophila palustris]
MCSSILLLPRLLKKNVSENLAKLPDLKVVDNYVYKRTEHASGDEKQEAESWKLWIPEISFPMFCIEHMMILHPIAEPLS